MGKPITAEHCQHVLRSGFQRQRNAAALELALMRPDAPLFETRAPGFRQHHGLGVGLRESGRLLDMCELQLAAGVLSTVRLTPQLSN